MRRQEKNARHTRGNTELMSDDVYVCGQLNLIDYLYDHPRIKSVSYFTYYNQKATKKK